MSAEKLAWLAGAAALAATAAGWMLEPDAFPHAWLAAVTAFIGWPLGSLAILLIHALTGGRWGVAIRPQLRAAIATLPLALPALIPLVLVAHRLYPWMDPAVAAALPNRFYLNAPFAAARLLVYLLVWLGLAQLCRRALRRADPERALRALAPGGLILLALTVTFAAIDSTLSLQPRFESSIYGWMVGSAAILLALSVAVLGCALGTRRAPLADLARLLLALLILWAYLDFMQLLIVWSSNLPREAQWYVPRLAGLWATVAAAIAVLHFLMPMLALTWPRAQRSRPLVAAVAMLLIALEAVRAWWIVIPAAARSPSWLDLAAMGALAALSAAAALHAFEPPAVPGGPRHG